MRRPASTRVDRTLRRVGGVPSTRSFARRTDRQYGDQVQPARAEPASSETAAASPSWVGPVLGVAVVCAGAAYPVTAAALRYTSASVITTTRALAGGLLMLPILSFAGAHLPRGWRAW